MVALVWDNVGERVYETGIRKGVLYRGDGSNGVAWNGLTSVEESTGNEVEPVYFDGTKVNDVVTLGDYSATLKALTYPDEFMFYEGTLEDVPGFLVTSQPTQRFGLSYQTLVSNDQAADDYKIHLVYSLTAIPSAKSFETLSDNTTPAEFEWAISAIPQRLQGYRPTAHVIIDSRNTAPATRASLEDILYGQALIPPRLPTLKEVATFLRGG